nr:MAG TPA: hypothetical protein [Caudoviricetes sp.]
MPAGTYPRNIMTCVISDWMLYYKQVTAEIFWPRGLKL